MKTYNVYVYFPASELEVKVKANSVQEAVEKTNLNGWGYLAKGVDWNDSSTESIRVLGVLEQVKL